MSVINGQLSIFDICKPIDYSYWIAEKLKEHCRYWSFDWLDKLAEDKTIDNFFRQFCKITKTYYFKVDADMYGVEFVKDGTGKVYKCGKHPERILEVIQIENILDQL